MWCSVVWWDGVSFVRGIVLCCCCFDDVELYRVIIMVECMNVQLLLEEKLLCNY